MNRSVRASLALAGLVACSNASGAACQETSPFEDVAVSDSFCSNAEWLKNRGVTLGCDDGTNFCPLDTVTRAQMALFMNRLADAVLPQPLIASESFVDKLVAQMGPPLTICSIDIPDAAHMRWFSITGTVSLIGDGDNDVLITAEAGDASGNFYGYGLQYGWVEPVRWTSIPVMTAANLGPGPATIRLALRTTVWKYNASGVCNLRVNVQSETGTTSPY